MTTYCGILRSTRTYNEVLRNGVGDWCYLIFLCFGAGEGRWANEDTNGEHQQEPTRTLKGKGGADRGPGKEDHSGNEF
jgi:hypothetical protein